jgi:hypothetical protein
MATMRDDFVPTHVVLRELRGDGLNIGDIVDGRAWRNTAKLEALRYLRPLLKEEADAHLAKLNAAKNPQKPVPPKPDPPKT